MEHEEREASGPLAGLKVVDCTRGTAGPRTTGLLADYGAEVVWIEPPGGDPWREALAVEYAVFNRGKRSVILDLGDQNDRAHMQELLASADVFVQSWRPGAAERLGLDYAALHPQLPGLVVCSITGFGPDGPHRDVPGHEALVHAIVGTMAEQVGHREGPIFEAIPFASIGTAYLAVIGVIAALLRREDDGAGRHVETSLLDGALAYLSMMWGDTDATKPAPAAGAHRLVTRSFLCADGEYIGVHTGAVGAFGRLVELLDLADRIPASESGMDMGLPLTPDEQRVLSAEIERIFASQPRSVWIQRLLAADICAIPHLPPTAIFDEPQTRHNEMVVEVDDPVLGRVEQVAPAAKFSATPASVRGPAPVAGQHSDDVLNSLGAERQSVARHRGLVDTRPLLDGIKILDLGAFYAGPYSSRLLADLGADVIKLEPIAGDPLHRLLHVFRSAQAGKRALAIDLKDPDTQPALAGLIEWCDILHHNLRPGAAERLGVDYERARSLNPGIVYLYAPGWGSTGPDRNRQSFAPMMSGYAGCGLEVAGQFNPPLFPAGNEDSGNGLLGAAAMLMGLLHRRRTGEGQVIENPQLNATMTHIAHMVRRPDGSVLGAGRLDPLQLGFGALERLYETSDGWLCVVAATDAEVAALGAATGVDLARDERFATRRARSENDYALGQCLAEVFRDGTSDKWLAKLAEAGVPAAQPVPHNAVAFLRDPENQRSGRVAEVSHPEDGHVRELAVLVRVSDAETAPHRVAPILGQHTDEILAWLGYESAKIASLRDRGAAR